MHRLLIVVFAGVLLGSPARAQPPLGIGDLAWLQGCWRDSTPDRTVEEAWMAPLGDSMVGVSRTVAKGERLQEFEVVAIRSTAAGLVFEAHPSGQPPATFTMTSGGRGSALFENPAHDFPQRIGYELRQGSELLAWIEGTRSGRSRRIEFRYRRVNCP